MLSLAISILSPGGIEIGSGLLDWGFLSCSSLSLHNFVSFFWLINWMVLVFNVPSIYLVGIVILRKAPVPRILAIINYSGSCFNGYFKGALWVLSFLLSLFGIVVK